MLLKPNRLPVNKTAAIAAGIQALHAGCSPGWLRSPFLLQLMPRPTYSAASFADAGTALKCGCHTDTACLRDGYVNVSHDLGSQ